MKSKFGIRFWLGLVTICLALAPGLWAQSSLSSKTGCGHYDGTTLNETETRRLRGNF